MPQDVRVDWNKDVLHSINTFSLDEGKHDSVDEKRNQAKRAVKDLMSDKQVRKAMELLAAE